MSRTFSAIIQRIILRDRPSQDRKRILATALFQPQQRLVFQPPGIFWRLLESQTDQPLQSVGAVKRGQEVGAQREDLITVADQVSQRFAGRHALNESAVAQIDLKELADHRQEVAAVR